MKRFIVFLFSFALFNPLFAEKTSIIEIGSSVSEEKGTISVRFLENYQESPTINYGKGAVRLSFPNTIYSPELNFVRINDGFIRAVRFFPMVDGSLMEIEFADVELDRTNYVDFANVNGNIEVVINKNKTIEEEPLLIETDASGDSGITPIMQIQTQNNDSSLTNPNIPLGTSWSVYSLKILLILILILGLFYLLLYLYKKYLNSGASFRSVRHNIKIVSSFFLGPKQKIMIVKINEANYALGVTNTNIGLIGALDGEELGEFEKLARENSTLSLSDLRVKFLESQKTSRESSKSLAPAKKSFADELQDKLKKLKPMN